MEKYYIYITLVRHPKLGTLVYAGLGSKENYHGSSRYRWWAKWLREHPEWFQTRILRRFEFLEDAAHAESELILKCLHKYGSFQKGSKQSDGTPKTWLDQFNYGRCLNAHWSSCEHLHTEENFKKGHERSLQTRKQSGLLKKWRNAASDPEVIRRATETKIKTGSLYRAQKMAVEALTHEVRVKMAKSRNYQEISKKRVENRSIPKRVQVQCGDFIGSVLYCCRCLGNPGWQVAISKQIRNGKLEIDHHGHKFKVISVS